VRSGNSNALEKKATTQRKKERRKEKWNGSRFLSNDAEKKATTERKKERSPILKQRRREKDDDAEKKPTFFIRLHNEASTLEGGSMASEAKKKTVYRDSIDGQFIAKKEADRRPASTEKQRLRVKPSTKTVNPKQQGE
jgi:hypothetical protein